MNRRDFERLVAEALDGLPDALREDLDNVEVVVEDWPDAETLRLAEWLRRAKQSYRPSPLPFSSVCRFQRHLAKLKNKEMER